MRLDDFAASIDQTARTTPDSFAKLTAAATNEIAAAAGTITQPMAQVLTGYRGEKHRHGGADADAEKEIWELRFRHLTRLRPPKKQAIHTA